MVAKLDWRMLEGCLEKGERLGSKPKYTSRDIQRMAFGPERSKGDGRKLCMIVQQTMKIAVKP